MIFDYVSFYNIHNGASNNLKHKSVRETANIIAVVKHVDTGKTHYCGLSLTRINYHGLGMKRRLEECITMFEALESRALIVGFIVTQTPSLDMWLVRNSMLAIE